MQKHFNEGTRHFQMDFDKITENIWIGTNMCCTVHGAELLELGFQADIDLEEERQEEPPHTEIYLRLPTVDQTPPKPSQLRTGAAALREIVNSGLKVYVHCHNGHGRAPTLVAAYFILEKAMSVSEAVDFIKRKRPAVHLSEPQLKALGELEKQSMV